MLVNLEALRGIAALMIVLIHCEKIIAFTGIPFTVRDPLFAGIDIFFVISGFIMVYITGQRPTGAYAFFLARVARIVPVYWLFTAVLATLLAASAAMRGAAFPVADLIRSLFFIPYGTVGPNFPPILYVGWTLNFEMYFYLMFSIALMLARTRRGLLGWLALLLSAPVIAAALLPAENLPLAFYGRWIVLEFLAGAILGAGFRRLAGIPPLLAVTAIILGIFWIFADPLAGRVAVENGRYFPAAVVIVAGVIALELSGYGIRHKSALFMGGISYALYVSHILVISVFNNLQRNVELLQSPAGAWTVLVAAVFSAVAFASIIHRFYERPLARRLKSILPVRTVSGSSQP